MEKIANRIRQLIGLSARLKRREKAALIGGFLIVAGVLSFYLFQWYQAANMATVESLRTREVYLSKQFDKISRKGDIQKQLQDAREELQKLENRLLPGEKPPVAAAELQKILKDIAGSLGLDIRSERPMATVDMGAYLGVPVEVSFVCPTAKLKDMLSGIETSPLLLTVTDMKVSVANIMNPNEVYTFLVVRGLIRKEAGLEAQTSMRGREDLSDLDIEAWQKEQDKNPRAQGRRR